MMKSIRRILVLVALVFGFGMTAVTVHAPIAKADLVDDANKGKEEAEAFGLGAIGIALIVSIAGTVFCILFPPTRRFGIALLSGLLILVFIVIVSKGSSIGETIRDIAGADSVTDILSK
jgi:hypothetical protein